MSEKTKVVDRMIMEIREGKYKPSDKLPSENDLADQYKVPRMVIRKAYERLQELGYIFSKQGKGSFVQNQSLQIPLILTGDVSFSEKMQRLNYEFHTSLLCCEPIEYDPQIYHVLQARQGDLVYKISRLRIVENCPIAIHTSFLPQKVFREIGDEGKNITSIFQYYQMHGFRQFESMRSELTVEFPNESSREVLKCPSLVPLLVLESGCKDRNSGKVLEYSKILYRSDCFTYVI